MKKSILFALAVSVLAGSAYGYRHVTIDLCSLDRGVKFDASRIESFLKNLDKDLRSLALVGDSSEFAKDIKGDFLRFLPANIEELSISGCPNMIDDNFKPLKNCIKLKKLELYKMDGLTEGLVEFLPKSLKKLFVKNCSWLEHELEACFLSHSGTISLPQNTEVYFFPSEDEYNKSLGSLFSELFPDDLEDEVATDLKKRLAATEEEEDEDHRVFMQFLGDEWERWKRGLEEAENRMPENK